MGLTVWTPFDFLKAKAAEQGETHTWADGTTRRKVGKKWVIVGRRKTVKEIKADALSESNRYFDYAMASNLGNVVDEVLEELKIKDFNALVKKIKTGPANTAHKIYKKIVDRINTSEAVQGDRKAVVDMFGQALIGLKKQYSTTEKPKAQMKITSKTGTQYYKHKDTPDLPTLKASTVAKAKKKMGGWSITGPLEHKHIQAMLKNKTAKVVSGKINGKRKWHLPKKAADMEIKYKGKFLMIRAKQIYKIKGQIRASAKVEIKIPYAYAKAFLQTQIASAKTKNNLIFRMEHSVGYRDFLEGAAA